MGGNKKRGLYCTIAGFFYRSLEREGSMTWSLEMKWTVVRALWSGVLYPRGYCFYISKVFQPFVFYCRGTMISFPTLKRQKPKTSARLTIPKSSLLSKPRFNLPLRILQRPLTPRLATPHPIRLRPREPLRLHRRIIPNRRPPLHLLIAHDLIRLSIRPLIHRHDGGAAQAEIMLQGDFCAGNEAGVGPAAELPDELGALC